MLNTVLYEDKWCKYPLASGSDTVSESSLGSATPWIHAGSRGAILDQSIWRFGRLHSGSRCFALHAISRCSTQSRAERGRAKIYRDRSGEFGTRTMFDQDIRRISGICLMEIHRVSLPAGNLIVINIMFSATSAITGAGEKHKMQSTHTHTHTGKIQVIHTSRQPLNQIAFSCFTLSVSHTNTSRIQ